MSVNQNWLIFRLGNEIGLIAVLGSKKRSFYVGDPNSLGFSVAIEVDLVLERGVEVGFIFVCWPKVTWFQCTDWNWLSVLRGDRTWLGFLGGTKLNNFLCGDPLTWFSAGGPNWIVFCGSAENDVLSVGDSKIAWIMWGWSKLTCFQRVGSTLSWFWCRGRNWLTFFVWVVEIRLVFMSGHQNRLTVALHTNIYTTGRRLDSWQKRKDTAAACVVAGCYNCCELGVRTYAKTCAIDVWVEGICRGTQHGEQVRRQWLSYRLKATERRLRETLTTYYSGDSASH